VYSFGMKKTAKASPAKKSVKKVARKGANNPSKAASGVTFKDWGFRLAVIEALHESGKLKAEMKRAANAAADAEPYEVSAAARAILDAIPLTTELLSKVRSLTTDGGSEVYHCLTSEWDGEDDLFDIRSLEDLVHLPKIEELTLISMCARGVDLSPVTKASSLKQFACHISKDWVKGLDAVNKKLRAQGVTVEP
jgi:hypothetical protein